MKQTSIELGKKLVFEHFTSGQWYYHKNGTKTTFMKFEKFIIPKNDDSRVFLKCSGFVTLHGAIHTPKIAKEEPFVYCWAEEYIAKYNKIEETEVKREFELACKNSYDSLF